MFFCSPFPRVATKHASYANMCSMATLKAVEQHAGSLYQQIFTCSKSTVETLEKCVKYIPEVSEVILISLWLTLNLFHIFF